MMAVIMLVCSILLSNTVWGSAASVIEDFHYTVQDGAATITKYTGASGEVTVPDTIGGYPVTAIGPCAFMQTDVTGIVIPARVSSIGGAAFEGCQKLTAVTLPEGLTAISDSLFYYCEHLKTVTIPDGVTRIGDNAFAHCQKLTNLILPDRVGHIGDSAFIFCGALTNVHLPKLLATVGSYAFGFCTNLKQITIPEGTTEIGSCAWIGCSNLTELDLPSTLKSMGASAFADCSCITKIVIPEGVTSIASSLFYGCTKLKDIDFPVSVVHVEGGAFANTPWLENYPGDFVMVGQSLYQYKGTDAAVIIPDGVTDICAQAFYENSRVERVVIPSGVLRIGYSAFSRCTSLEEITIPDTVTDTDVYSFQETPWLEKQEGLVVAGKVLIAYRGSDADVTVPDYVTAIGESAFTLCDALKTVTIPAAVEFIGENNFLIVTGGGDGVYSTQPMAITIQGYAGSFANQYASANQITFKNIGPLRGLPTKPKVLMNGAQVNMKAYNINGHNFFRLRDIATILSGTNRQFDIKWDNAKRNISILTGLPYSPVGGEMDSGAVTEQNVAASAFPVSVDGRQIPLTFYLIHGNDYVKLRDILRILNVNVEWDGAHNTILVNTAKGYVAG